MNSHNNTFTYIVRQLIQISSAITAHKADTCGYFISTQNTLSTLVEVEHHYCTEHRKKTKYTTWNEFHIYSHKLCVIFICSSIYKTWKRIQAQLLKSGRDVAICNNTGNRSATVLEKNTCQGINQAPFIYKSVTTGKIASVTEQYPPTYICWWHSHISNFNFFINWDNKTHRSRCVQHSRLGNQCNFTEHKIFSTTVKKLSISNTNLRTV